MNLITMNGATVGYVKNENGTWKASKTAHFRSEDIVAVGKSKKVATQRFLERV